LMLKSPFYPCLFVPSLQIPPALSRTEFVSHYSLLLFTKLDV
jgi:hypothetical protein